MTRTEIFYSFGRFTLCEVSVYKKDLKDGEMFEQDTCIICFEKLSDSFAINNFEHNKLSTFGKIKVAFNSIIDSINHTREVKPKMEDGKNNYIRISCGHEFHLPCFMLWLKEKAKCPTCSQKVTVIKESNRQRLQAEPRQNSAARVNEEEDIQRQLQDIQRQFQEMLEASLDNELQDIERQFQEMLENQDRRPSRPASEHTREGALSVGSTQNRLNNSQNSVRVGNLILSFEEV